MTAEIAENSVLLLFSEKLVPKPTAAAVKAKIALASAGIFSSSDWDPKLGIFIVVPVTNSIPDNFRIDRFWHETETNGRKKQIKINAKKEADIFLVVFTSINLLNTKTFTQNN